MHSRFNVHAKQRSPQHGSGQGQSEPDGAAPQFGSSEGDGRGHATRVRKKSQQAGEGHVRYTQDIAACQRFGPG